MTDPIKLEGVSVEQLQLLDDKVLVRVVPREEVRASGLWLMHGRPEHQVGSEFYGEVVATGPGTLVRDGPTPDQVADLASDRAQAKGLNAEMAGVLHEEIRLFMEQHRPMRRVPPDWKPGDQVLVKQGFGVEMDLREGRHHVIERAGKFGHGILAAWSKEHVHCWHLASTRPPDQCNGIQEASIGACACGETRVIDTRLPSCAECPPGERLAEAVLGGKHVYDVKIPDAPVAPMFDPEAPGFRAGELRPE